MVVPPNNDIPLLSGNREIHSASYTHKKNKVIVIQKYKPRVDRRPNDLRNSKQIIVIRIGTMTKIQHGMGLHNFAVSVRYFPMRWINCLKSCLPHGIATSSKTTPRVKVLCSKIKLHFSKTLVLLMLKTISGQFMFLILLLQTELDQNPLPLEMPNNIIKSNLGTGSLGSPKEWLAQCCLFRPAVS